MADIVPESDNDTVSRESQQQHKLWERASERFDNITEAVQIDRAEMLNDRRFVAIAGAQWEGAWAAQFENSIMVEINKTAQGTENIESDYRQNRVTVNFRGVGKGADEETASTLDDMFRADVYACKGGQAFDNAFSEAVAGGMGAWRLTNVYEDDLDPDNDQQRIAINTIVDADQTVFFDLNSTLYDKSDAQYAFVLTAMTPAAFEAKYDQDPNSWDTNLYKTFFDWRMLDVVYVAEYYEMVEKRGTRHVFQNRATGEEMREWASDLTAEDMQDREDAGWRLLRSRTAKRRRVTKTVLSGGGVLRKTKVIAGSNIPLVPVYGKRWFIDNLERARGHVRLAKDPQRVYNANISKLVETAALSPIERPVFTPQQIAGHEQAWADANINRSPYSLVNPLVNELDGSIIQTGPVATITPPTLPPVLAALIQITAADIAELTSADDGADEVKANVSAEAMDIAATRVDKKSAIYMDNMRQSMQRCGEIYLDMARDVYFEEGREVETLTEQGDHGTATLVEGVTDPKTGKYTIRNDLSKGRYKVISDVSEQTSTRRDKTVKTLVGGAQMVAAFDPELAGAMMTTALLQMDGEGMQDLQDWARSRAVAAGIVKPTPEEQAAQQEAAQNAQPDQQAEFLRASAAKADADAGKAVADTQLSVAKTAQTVAETDKTRAETKMTVMERVKSFVNPPKPDKPKVGPPA